MKQPLNIVIFDGTLKTTSFINRLIKGLAKEHTIMVVGFNSDLPNPIPKVHYTSVGSASKTFILVVKGVVFAFKKLLLLGDIAGFVAMLGTVFLVKKKNIQKHNFETAIALFKPDIIHVQWPSLLPWIENFTDETNLKVVLSQRGYQNNVRPFVTPENLAYLKKMYPKIDGFHSVSKDMVVTSNKIFESASKIDKVVYSGFNFEKLPFIETVTKNETLEIISIGRPHWKKGYSYALKAMELLQSKGMSFHYKIIGGEGNEELSYLLSAYSLSNSVSILPKMSQEAVYELMCNSDVFLLPSLEEGLPNVVIEAMAIGLPVIATNCGGIAELIGPTTGVLIPTRDAKAMASALISFAKNPSEVINSRRLEARKRVEVRHTEEQMVRRMEDLYLEVLKIK